MPEPTLTKTEKSKTAVPTRDSSQAQARQVTPIGPVAEMMGLHESVGNRAMRQVLQAKLTINQPGDKYEQEADRIAEMVMRMPEPDAVNGISHVGHGVQRKCAACAVGEKKCAKCHEEEEKIQRKPLAASITPLVQRHESNAATPVVTPQIAANINSLRGNGRPLPDSTRAFFEPRFGVALSDVRIYANPEAAKLNRELNARAFTIGTNIYFDSQEYKPFSQAGKRLLAHELSHIIQQKYNHINYLQMDPRHDKASAGEQGVAFSHYRREDGWAIVRGPGGKEGHEVTTGGEDGLAYNVRTGELHIYDNKSFRRSGNVSSATAIDPNKTLGKNLDSMIKEVTDMAPSDFPYRQDVLRRLRQLKAAIKVGGPLPARTRLVVTNYWGHSTGVTERLSRLGVTFRDVNSSTTSRPGAQTPQIGVPQRGPVAPSGGTASPVTPSTSGGGQATPSAGTAKPVTGTRGEIDVQSATPSQGSAKQMPLSRVVARGAASGAVAGALDVAAGIIKEKVDKWWIEKKLKMQWPALEAEIKNLIEQQRDLILTHQVADPKKLYAIVTLDKIFVESPQPSTSGTDPLATGITEVDSVYHHTEITDFSIEEKEINKDDDGEAVEKIFADGTLADAWLPGVMIRHKYFKRSFPIDLPPYKVLLKHAQAKGLPTQQLNPLAFQEIDALEKEPGFEFEKLILESYSGGLFSKEVLLDYTEYRYRSANHSDWLQYWGKMKDLVKQPIAAVISQAKKKSIPLDQLRAHALKEGWGETIKLVDEPLQGRELVHQRWVREEKHELPEQEKLVMALKERRDFLNRRLDEIRRSKEDFRTPNEKRAGEPPHPDWKTYNRLHTELESLLKRIPDEVESLRILREKHRDKRPSFIDRSRGY